MIGAHIDYYESDCEDATGGAADVSSPSSVRCWFDCRFKWYCKYVLGVPEEYSAALSWGSAAHEALGENFAQKIASKTDLPIEGVVALFRQAWNRLLKWTRFRPDQNPKELGMLGERSIRKYMSERAPAIQPVAVEPWLSGVIGGVNVRGRLDILDERGGIIETKSMSSRRKASAMHKFQATTYRMLEPRATGRVEFDGLVKTKTPALTKEDWVVTPDDCAHAEKIYAVVRAEQRTGLFGPNRFSILCNRGCPYAEKCLREWGGPIPE